MKLIMGKLIKGKSPSRIARIVTLFCAPNLHQPHRLTLSTSSAESVHFKLNANSTWHVIRPSLASLLNSSSHALIYNLSPRMNLQSDNIYVVLFSFWLTIEEARFARFNVGTTERRLKQFCFNRSKRNAICARNVGKREKLFSCATLEQ